MIQRTKSWSVPFLHCINGANNNIYIYIYEAHHDAPGAIDCSCDHTHVHKNLTEKVDLKYVCNLMI